MALYKIRLRNITGSIIDTADSYIEALNIVKYEEWRDKIDGDYEPNTYEITKL